MSQLIMCDTHGQSPGYCVCLHVLAGAKAVWIVPATEEELGEALCADCVSKELTADDLQLMCAGHFAEMKGAVGTAPKGE